MAKRSKSSYIIKSVDRAIDLLEEFTGDVKELGVTELARRLKLHKNNVFRLLATLENRGYIEQNKTTENYRLGLKSLELGQTYIRQMGIVRQTRPVMEKLAKKVNENVYIGIAHMNSAIYLDVVESNQIVRVVSRVGWRFPIYCSAIGKVIAAYKSETELEKLGVCKNLKKFTENTISDEQTFKKELEQIRKQGYALDNEEYDIGVRCVAVPIRDYTRQVVAGLAVSSPSCRVSEQKIKEEILPELLKAGEEISKRLGYDES
ncbi:MAG: IclR family transcriptional regulator [Deltaproteobacteria bacterium]|nr:IclR family transcriptional regulator [Deltaproteobacteria bacterium]RLA89302.1 MAG: IclR family transcriptional regulator [Deltaproteobacteria bacterium]